MVLGVIQCRFSSRRLPGKALEDLAGRPALAWVIERARRARRIEHLVVASTTAIEDDAVTELAWAEGMDVIRGSEADVLSRFITAAQKFPADRIVRITADNPLVDPQFMDMIIEASAKADYTYPARAPIGAGVDVFDARALEVVAEATGDQRHREHINAYFLDHYLRYRIVGILPPFGAERSDVRITLDTTDDLKRLRALFAELNDPAGADMEAVVAAYDRLPASLKPMAET